MFRPATRLIASNAVRAAPRIVAGPATWRYISTAPPTQKSRSWKSLFARVGAAGAIIYYYNTTDVFAEEPQHAVASLPITATESETDRLPTIDDLAAARLQRKAEQDAVAAQLAAQKDAQTQKDGSETLAMAGSVEEIEEEAGQQGAFNPETGEINWDCPCLGGMADGPCGEEFKAAFSCFVYSSEEPKGMDCIEKFKDMQGCFRQYPDVYGSELDSDADDDDDEAAAMVDVDVEQPAPAGAAQDSTRSSEGVHDTQPLSDPVRATPAPSAAKKQGSGLVPDAYRAGEQVQRDHEATSESASERLVPRAAQDAADARSVEKK